MNSDSLRENCVGLILAAGKGTRMHSPRPKVLHTLLGEPMLAYVLAAFEPLFGQNTIVVAGHQAEKLVHTFPAIQFVFQEQQLGTGHALKCALSEIQRRNAAYVAIANGDTPLITTGIMRAFLEEAWGADVAFATITPPDPGSYGRVVRVKGRAAAIVEAKDYDENRHGPLGREVNAGIYLLKVSSLRDLLPLLGNSNKSGEYYITDLVELAAGRSLDVRGIECGSSTALMGINSPAELTRMEEMLRTEIVDRLLEKGVVFHAPELARVSPFAEVEPGAEICGPCEIYGLSRIHSGARVESFCVVSHSLVCGGAHIRSFSHLDHASVGENAIVGPYARLRPGAILETGAHVGNFVEMKKARLGEGAKANHLTYLGDAEIGARVNIGAGTITCNYNGINKFRTEIGEKAFIGSNSALVAPVKIGAGAIVGAGSTITRDVPENDLAIARNRQKNIPRRDK